MKNLYLVGGGAGLFLVGAAAGSAVTWFLTKKKFESKADEEIQKFTEEYKTSVLVSLDREVEDVLQEYRGESPEEVDHAPSNSKNYNQITRSSGEGASPVPRPDGPRGEDSVNEDKNSSEEFLNDTGESETIESEDEIDEGEDRGFGPHLITQREYSEECRDFDKITLTYYAEDEFLCEEDETLITDWTSFLGEDALDNFGKISGDPSIVYVRNRSHSADYEVIRNKGSYMRLVCGIKEEREDRVKRMRPDYD